MSNWDPPSQPEPALPPQGPAQPPASPAAATALTAEPAPKKRGGRFKKIALGSLGALVGLVVLVAIFGDSDDQSVTTETTDEDTPIASLPPSTTATGATQPTPTTTPASTTPEASVVTGEVLGGGSSATTPLPTWTAVSITDGDTLDVTGPGGTWTVRLIGINTPETGECFADEAAAALAALTAGELTLVADVSDVDQFDRKLRYIETADGRDVGAELVRGGYAISRRYDPDTARNGTYEALQSEAEATGVGLWAPDACGPATADVSIDLDVRYDADGDDNQNKNDEWVRFTNTGTAPLDLNGWQVADESASHRYIFRDLVLQPGSSVTLFTGCGTESDTERYWCKSGSAVWNNSGDTVFLRDPSGNNLVAESYEGN